MMLLSTFPRFNRQTLAAAAMALGVFTASQFQPPAPPATSTQPVVSHRCPYQEQNVEEFGGIGLYVGSDITHEDRFTALQPLEGYPAARSGIQTDDVIESVDGVSTAGLPAEQVITRLRGDVGTDVQLSVYRPSNEARFTLTLTRVLVRAPRCTR